MKKQDNKSEKYYILADQIENYLKKKQCKVGRQIVTKNNHPLFII